MTGLSSYGVLAEDPTAEAIICWVDDREGADGSEQALEYDDGSESATGEEVPESDGAYKYEVEITGLNPDTEYSGTIDGEKTIQWRTLPDSLDDDELTVVVMSDIHVYAGDYVDTLEGDVLEEPEDIQPMADEDPDIVLVAGDFISNADDVESDRTEDWLRFLDEMVDDVLNEDRIRPILAAPGNHDVGNHSFDGTGNVDPETGYFQFLFSNPKNLEPVGENYGEITVGDYLQLLALDTHSAFPEDVGEWLEGAIDETVNHVIPFHHSPFMGGGERQSADLDLQERLRNEWGAHFYEAENIYTQFSGHVHVHSQSVPWAILDEEPGRPSKEVETDGGTKYLAGAQGNQLPQSVTEFGQGYPSHRSLRDGWWLEFTEENNQFYSVSVGEESMTVSQLDEEGGEYDSHSFPLEEGETYGSSGAIMRVWQDGGWVPPV